MRLLNLQLTDLDEEIKLIDALINECHAIHFSVRTLAAVLLAPKAPTHNRDAKHSGGLVFAALSVEDSNTLIKTLQVKMNDLTIRIRNIISPPTVEDSSRPCLHHCDSELLVLQLGHCIANNIVALDNLKAYRHAYLHCQKVYKYE